MLTVVIKRSDEPRVIHATQSDLIKQLSSINDAEIILEDTWLEGLKRVRTPYVSLVEPDAVFSANYYVSNYGLMKKAHQKKAYGGAGGGGGYQRLAMVSSCLGIKTFADRIYNYELRKKKDGHVNGVEITGWHSLPSRKHSGTALYHAQIGFVPGAVIRMTAIKDIMEDELWLGDDLVKLSTALSFYLWDTGKHVQVNPSTTYVSLDTGLVKPPLFEPYITDRVKNIFSHNGIGIEELNL